MKIKSKESLLVKSFVQSVSAATTFGKRYKKVCRLLDSRPQLSDQQWIYIWRGLYYSVWYSEMNKGCDQLIQRIGIYDNIPMLLNGFQAITNDWFGIDAFRVDKYMFLVRVMINTCLKLQIEALIDDKQDQSLTIVNNECIDANNNNQKTDDKKEETNDSEDEEINGKSNKQQNRQKYRKRFDKRNDSQKKEMTFDMEFKANVIDKILMTVKSSIGLTLHLSDIFIEEFQKVLSEMRTKLNNREVDIYYHILVPFVKLIAVIGDHRVLSSLKTNIFDKFKNQLLIAESVDTRNQVLNKLISAMVTIGGVELLLRRNRDIIYDMISIFKQKVYQLTETNPEFKSIKRTKIFIGRGRHKKVKYEMTSKSPFVTSIVPIPVL
ncbi:uncharacterized protein LOC128951848 [Oppia nitens]|uniref:uncharacterized protein LOC128951848 n=1 Tax=Oppia nitens TaxID=1686743 RepID=UPI0023DAEBAE|nr:uncharacterized protein LOC128951848 [Oppia nitens]